MSKKYSQIDIDELKIRLDRLTKENTIKDAALHQMDLSL